jgi:hypothetical protein
MKNEKEYSINSENTIWKDLKSYSMDNLLEDFNAKAVKPQIRNKSFQQTNNNKGVRVEDFGKPKMLRKLK